MQRLLVTLGLLMVTFGAVLAAVGGRAQTPAAPPAKPLYGMVYMHHYVGGGGFYPSAEDLRAFAQLTQKYQVPATFFFDGILVERLQKEDPTIFEYLNRLKVPLGYHGEETHGPPPVVGGRSGCVGYGKSWNEAVQAVRERYSHRIVPGSVDPRTKQMDVRQGGQSDLTKIGGLALVRKAFGRDVSIITAHSIESAPAGYAFQQLSQFRVEQPAIPTVGAAGAVMRNVPPELIREAMTIGGFENDFFYFMNRLQYKGGRQRPAENLPFRFLEVGLTATPPFWMTGVEERLRQLAAQVRAVPGSRFVTPDELANLFAAQNAQPVSKDELRRIAEKLLADWKDAPPDFVNVGEQAYSLVNAYEALAKALAHYSEKKSLPDRVTVTDLYGPIAERSETTNCKAGEVSLSDLCAAAAAALKEAERLNPKRVPVKVTVGKTELNCAEFLRAMAQAYLLVGDATRDTQHAIQISSSKVTPPYADFLSRFFQPDDDRPLIYSQLQLWTVKPAIAKGEGRKADGAIRTFFAVHCEAGTANVPMWNALVRFVEMADRYDAKLTLMFNPQWTELILADKERFERVKAWQKNGHEVALHYHTIRHGNWCGYTNRAEWKQDPRYRGSVTEMTELVQKLAAPDKVVTACCGIDVASTQFPRSTSAESIVDEVDFPDDILYDVDGIFDGMAKPISFTFKGKERLHLRHHFLNPRNPQTLELIKAEFARAQSGEVLGVVTHEGDFARGSAFVEEWFKFLQACGVKIRTVRDIAGKMEGEASWMTRRKAEGEGRKDERTLIQFRMNVNYFPDEAEAQENCRQLRRHLELFKQAGVKASYWFTGLAAEQIQRLDPEFIRLLNEAGMPVAHHGANRPPKPMPIERVKGQNWQEDVQAILDYESHALDPRTGKLDKTRVGGLKRMQQMFGNRIQATGRFFQASILYVTKQFGCRAMVGLKDNTGGSTNAAWFLGMKGMPDARAIGPEMLRAAAMGQFDLSRFIEDFIVRSKPRSDSGVASKRHSTPFRA